MQEKKIKVGVVGAGMMGKNHIKTYKTIKDVELVGIYDIDEKTSKETAKNFGCKSFSSLDEMIKEVEAVSIVTTSVTHGEIGKKFLNQGVHTLIEKPLAVSQKECEALIKASKEANKILLVGHIERFNPAILKLGEILEKGIDIQGLSAKRMSKASGRITDVDVGMDLMIHDIEVILSLVKSKVKSVSAQAVDTSETNKKDYITALISFENGVIADATASRITSNRIRTLDVSTKQAFFELDYVKQELSIINQGQNPLIESDKAPDWAKNNVGTSKENLFIPKAQALTSELNHFIDCINGKTEPKITGQNALDALKVMWQIQKELGI